MAGIDEARRGARAGGLLIALGGGTGAAVGEGAILYAATLAPPDRVDGTASRH